MQHCLHDPKFSCFDTIPTCDRETDGQTETDTWQQYIPSSMRSHGSMVYLVNFVKQNTVTEIIEVDGMVWKERLYACDGINGHVDETVICRSDKDEMWWSFVVSEMVEWKSKLWQLHRVLVQWQLSDWTNVSWSMITKLFNQRPIRRRVSTAQLCLRLQAMYTNQSASTVHTLSVIINLHNAHCKLSVRALCNGCCVSCLSVWLSCVRSWKLSEIGAKFSYHIISYLICSNCITKLRS